MAICHTLDRQVYVVANETALISSDMLTRVLSNQIKGF